MSHDFVLPTRKILSPTDVKKWLSSQAFDDLVQFVLKLNNAVRQKTLIDCKAGSCTITRLLACLDHLDSFIDLFPPSNQPQRFGNKSYRQWNEKLTEESERLVREILDQRELFPSSVELTAYLSDSFGNSTRIDYGTGHETCFVIFLLCLYKIGLIEETDFEAVVSKVFERYLRLCRRLQLTYRMEPAGSHGVWCLDDYQFLPFLFGSSQLIGNPSIEPNSFVQEGFADNYADTYMFMGSISFINQVKNGPFAEHSNQLWNISGVPNWSKINSGLIEMYKREVLGKFPIVQHFVFGKLFNFEPKV